MKKLIMTEKNKKTIFITILRGLLIRNFFHSGVVNKLLGNGYRVVACVPHYWNANDVRHLSRPNLVFENLPPPTPARGKRILEEFSKGAVFNSTVHVRYRYRFAGKKPNRALYFVRMFFFAPLVFFPGFKKILRFVESVLYPERQCDYLFDRYNPALVFNTAAGQDFPLMKSARRYGVPMIDMPKSWDNSSKLLFRVKADYVFAWGPFMARQLLRFQGYSPEEIILTGVPQFDIYAQKKSLLSRTDFCKQFGLNPDKKIILYASVGGDCCDEIGYIELLKKYIKNGTIRNAQLFIRPHLKYNDSISRFNELKEKELVIVDTSAKQNVVFRDNWDISFENTNHLMNSLHHADVCVTVDSTITLDAVACGTEVINIGFDVKDNLDLSISVKTFFMSDYIKATMDYKGTWFVNNKKEFLEAFKDILEKDKTKKEKRERLIKYIMYRNDGKTTERIVQAIKEVMERSRI